MTDLEKYLLENVPKGPFVPYAFYNEDMNALEVYFKNDNCYTKTINDFIELHISEDTGEVVGVNVLKIMQVIKEGRKI